MGKVSVLLASNNRALRASLKSVLGSEDWIEVVASAGDRDEAVRLTRDLSPEVVVIDDSVTGDHLQACEEMMDVSPGVKVVVLGPPSKTDASHRRILRSIGNTPTESDSIDKTSMKGSMESVSVHSSPTNLIQSIRGWRSQFNDLAVEGGVE